MVWKLDVLGGEMIRKRHVSKEMGFLTLGTDARITWDPAETLVVT